MKKLLLLTALILYSFGFAQSTTCNVFPTPFIETFENGSSSKSCWSVHNENGDAHLWNLNETEQPIFGNQMAGMNTYQNGNNDDWLISPTITVKPNQRIRFYYKAGNFTFTEDLKVKLSTTGADISQFTTTLYENSIYTKTDYTGVFVGSTTVRLTSDPGVRIGDYIDTDGIHTEVYGDDTGARVMSMFNLTIKSDIPSYGNCTNINGTFECYDVPGDKTIAFTHEIINNTKPREMVINLPSGTVGDVNFAFQVPFYPSRSTYKGQNIFIDNVIVEDVPACSTPTNLSVSSNGTLSWTPGETETQWEVAALPKGSNGPNENTSGTIVISPTYTAVFSDFEPSNPCSNFYVRAICGESQKSEWSGPMEICASGDKSDYLLLTAFLDTNNNGLKDTGEVNFNYGNFEYDINNSGSTIHGNPYNGSYYIFENNPANTYNLSFKINTGLSSYYSSSATFSNIIVPAGNGTTTYYFPVTQTQPYNDIEVQVIPLNSPRPGFTYINWIKFKNNSSQTVNSGTVTFTKDNAVSITAISQTGTTSTAAGFTYNFTDLAPFEERKIEVSMQVPTLPTVTLGQKLTNTAAVEPLTNDDFPLNNTASLTQAIIGSYDPNEKTESHGEQIKIADFSTNDYLYYTTTFENTGTANAEFIRVSDALDSHLDENTFEMLGASHEVNTTRNGNELSWLFNSIDLPPTSSNPNESHGYVHFRIKPKTGFTTGTVIPGKANIYFDYNPAIITNTFNTEFVAQLSNVTFTSENIQLYPNPANNKVQISMQNTGENLESVVLYDFIGKRVYNKKNINTKQSAIDVSALAKGLYLVEITTASKLKMVKKLVIE